jgi:hypothetical protein
MRACCRLSSSRPEIDVNDVPTAGEQAVFDLTTDREVRRDIEGFVTPAQARAFLQASRQVDLRSRVIPSPDPITREYFRDFEPRMQIERDHASPVASSPQPPRPVPDDTAVTAMVELLQDLSTAAVSKADAGVMPHAPRALLHSAPEDVPRLARIRHHLHFVQDRAPAAYARRHAELAYLANVILAGSTIQSRPFTAEEASNGVAAVCNVGLENWPGDVPDGFLIEQDVVTVFQVGWTILHEDVCMYAADHLLAVVASLRCGDVAVDEALAALRATLTKHWRAGAPWHAREALDVIAILDPPSWVALLGLLDQFPTLHGAVGASLTGATRPIDPVAFEFISEQAQIHQVHEFMARLASRLT